MNSPVERIIIYIGQCVALYRKDRGLTQKELAQKICCSSSVISRIERGKYNRNISVALLFTIAMALRVKLIDLLPDEIGGYEDETR